MKFNDIDCERTITKATTRTEWLELRHCGVGGSDIGAIMGINPYRTPLDVYMDKTSPVSGEAKTNLAMFMGTELESAVVKYFEQEMGVKCRRPNGTYILDYKGIKCIANPDRLIEGTKNILECKTCNDWNTKFWYEGVIPPSYKAQINWYLGITGFYKCYIACLVGGNERYIILEHNFDEQEFSRQLIYAETFIKNFVQKGVRPSATSKDYDNLAKLYGKNVETKDITEIETEIAKYKANEEELKAIKDTMKDLEKENKELKTNILDFLEGCQGQSAIYKIKNSYICSPSVDAKRLMEELPEIYEKYKKESPFYRMTIKENL